MGKTDLLSGLRKLISRPECWSQDRLAADALGQPCRIEDTAAVCFSIIGAINRVAQLAGDRAGGRIVCVALAKTLATRLRCDLSRTDDPCSVAVDLIAAFNRITTHEGVMSLIDETMKE